MMKDALHSRLQSKLAEVALHLNLDSTLNNGSGMQKRSDDKVDGMNDDKDEVWRYSLKVWLLTEMRSPWCGRRDGLSRLTAYHDVDFIFPAYFVQQEGLRRIFGCTRGYCVS